MPSCLRKVKPGQQKRDLTMQMEDPGEILGQKIPRKKTKGVYLAVGFRYM